MSSLEQLGMRKQMLGFRRSSASRTACSSAAAPPACKSTTLYSALNDLDSDEVNIITIEDPVEYKMNGVTQIEINTKAGQSFAGSLRSVLRQDPDVVMIGEIRDDETAKIACQAANTGHMVFSTVHANDTITALYRLLDLGVEPFMISTSVSAIRARDSPAFVPHCKEAYKPKAEFPSRRACRLRRSRSSIARRPTGKNRARTAATWATADESACTSSKSTTGSATTCGRRRP
ncbi:MAG: ATPase, T2SS/T4P/T4SS family [Planctomycetaceae bacterium]